MKTHARYFFRAVKRHLAKRGWIWLAVLLAVSLFSHRFHFELNLTESLPQKLFLVDRGDRLITRGDYVAFLFSERGHGRIPSAFIKEVVCNPGETVVRENRKFSCGHGEFALAKTHSRKGEPLEASPTQTLKPYEWFVRGTHPDSLDSRYAMFGPVHENQIIGKAYPIF